MVFRSKNPKKTPPHPTPPPEYRKSGLPHRKTRLLKQYQDVLPPRPPVIITPVVKTPEPSQHEEKLPTMPKFETNPNSFGIYRIYKSGEPTFTPNNNFHVDSVANGPNFIKDQRSELKPTWASPFGTDFTQTEPPNNTKPISAQLPYLPFQNMLIFCLMG